MDISDFLDCFVGVERFDVRAKHSVDTGPGSAKLYIKDKDGNGVGYSKERLLNETIYDIDEYNRQGYHIYFRPMPRSGHYILVDDVKPDKLQKAKDSFASVIVETSANNFQAWFKTAIDSKALQQGATHTLVAELGGDPNARNHNQIGRMPFYINPKPQHKGFKVRVEYTNKSARLYRRFTPIYTSCDVHDRVLTSERSVPRTITNNTTQARGKKRAYGEYEELQRKKWETAFAIDIFNSRLRANKTISIDEFARIMRSRAQMPIEEERIKQLYSLGGLATYDNAGKLFSLPSKNGWVRS